MTGVVVLTIGLLATGELDLPHLIVEGSARIPAPERDVWPSPALPASPPPRLLSPRLSQPLGDAPSGPLRRPPPAGFGFRVGGGLRSEGSALLDMGEVAGGVAAQAWRYEAGDLDRRGVRAAGLVSGGWGSVTAHVQHWSDRHDGTEIVPGWVHGSIEMTTPLGSEGSLGARFTASDPDGDGFHGEATLQTVAPRLRAPMELTAGDRTLAGQVSWRWEPARFSLRGGAAMVDDGEPRWAAHGAARVGPLTWKRLAVTVGAHRSLRLIDGASLREGFPAAGGTSAGAELVSWHVDAHARVRVARYLTIEGSAAAREIDTAPAWRETGEEWRAESLSGRGARAALSASWWNGPVAVEGGVGTEGLRADRPDSGSRAVDAWPLVPRGTWWMRATAGTRPRLRVRIEGDWGMYGWDDLLPSSTGIALDVAMPLGRGWEAWSQAGRGWGWDLAPHRAGISIGVSWSLKRPYGQEGMQ